MSSGSALAALILAAAVLAACDPYYSAQVRVDNRSDQALIVVISELPTGVSTPGLARGFAVAPGESGWTPSMPTERGSLVVLTPSCDRVAQVGLSVGAYAAVIDADLALTLTDAERPGDAAQMLNELGDTCGLASGFATLPSGLLPTDGPTPDGSTAQQRAAALGALGLAQATDVTLEGPERARWLPATIHLSGLVVVNKSREEVFLPWEFTVLRWDGGAWIPEPCPTEIGQRAAHNGLCAWAEDYDLSILPNQIDGYGGSPFRDWPTSEVQPGTYALVAPLKSAPTTGVALILTITPNP